MSGRGTPPAALPGKPKMTSRSEWLPACTGSTGFKPATTSFTTCLKTNCAHPIPTYLSRFKHPCLTTGKLMLLPGFSRPAVCSLAWIQCPNPQEGQACGQAIPDRATMLFWLLSWQFSHGPQPPSPGLLRPGIYRWPRNVSCEATSAHILQQLQRLSPLEISIRWALLGYAGLCWAMLGRLATAR